MSAYRKTLEDKYVTNKENIKTLLNNLHVLCSVPISESRGHDKAPDWVISCLFQVESSNVKKHRRRK